MIMMMMLMTVVAVVGMMMMAAVDVDEPTWFTFNFLYEGGKSHGKHKRQYEGCK